MKTRSGVTLSIRGSVLKLDWSKVIQWAEQAIAPDAATVQVRLRDNHLYLLYEAAQGLTEKQTVSRLSAALQQNSLAAHLPNSSLSIDKIFLSGRTEGAKLPDWTVKLDYDEIIASSQSLRQSEQTSQATIDSPVLTQPASEEEQVDPSSPEVVPQSKTKNPFVTRLTTWFNRQPSQQHAPEGSNSETTPEIDAETVVPSKAATASSSLTPASKPVSITSRSGNRSGEHWADNQQKSPQSEILAEHSILSAPPKMSSPSSVPIQKEAPLHTVSVSPTRPQKDITGDILPAPDFQEKQAQSTRHQAMRGQMKTLADSVKNSIETPPQSYPNPGISDDVATVSTEVLARQGHPSAIASHLSEILEGLGVSVKVRRRNLSRRREGEATPSKPRQRLWVLCESAYSPDPSLLAEPIAQKLRELKLEHYQDACILLQVQGETKPDWMLRVDLTPPAKILKQWGRWGDAEAIAVLLNHKLFSHQLQVRATLKESTLHLVCYPHSRKKSQVTAPPDQSQVMGIIQPVLEKIAPQGIQAATVYGVEETNNHTASNTPLWVDWLNLPAAQQPDLQPHALTLAQQGNIEALKFLISRLINPDLDLKLATGGIRVMLLRKGNLLHVMTQGPTCPSQSKMVPPIRQFLRTAEIQDLTGAKIYGRRSGQKSPLWRCGLNLKSTESPSTSDPMEFVPSTESVGQRGGLVLRPNLPLIHLDTEEDSFSEQPLGSKWRTQLEAGSAWLQQSLVATGLFSTAEPIIVNRQTAHSGATRSQKASLALLWGALGCLAVWQADLILAQLVRWQSTQFSFDPVSGERISATEQNPVQMFSGTAENIALEYPTFNSSQLDEQLARYQAYIARHQQTPDVLVIGSSRALRGVDPAVLEEQLKTEGYGSLKVFNFGVNGATLQVVDLILRRALPPEQLPKLILIADGVRAMNSGRVDRTYESITDSEGYQQIAEGTFNIPTGELAVMESEATELQSGWWTGLGSDWVEGEGGLKQQLHSLSASYQQRDRLKQVLQSWVNQQVMIPPQATPDATAAEAEDRLTENIPALQSNGFLPMSVKFEPQTYYEKHSKVSGYYDGDYQGFTLEGKQITALNTLLEYVQSHGIDVVFVNMPLTQDYLDEVRRDYEQVFRQQMQQLQAQTHLTFIDLGLAWQNQYDYFSDPSHLNQYGAAAVSQRLAQESKIPWPR